MEGLAAVVSYWRRTKEELAILQAGGSVALWVIGATMPQVSLEVDPSPNVRRKPTPPGVGSPVPSPDLRDPLYNRFVPPTEVLAWARREILAEAGLLHNPDHGQLEFADIQYLWEPGGFARQCRMVLGLREEVAHQIGRAMAFTLQGARVETCTSLQNSKSQLRLTGFFHFGA